METLNKVASGICQTQLSILLFEENQENIDTALKQLQPLNCQIEPVHDVSLLLKKTMELYPNLVVMHYSKRALIQELKNCAETAGVPIFLISSYVEDAEKDRRIFGFYDGAVQKFCKKIQTVIEQ